MTEKFFQDNKNRILQIGEFLLQKLEDEELMEKVAEKDPEKLARVMKLLFELLDKSSPKAENPALAAIIEAMGGNDRDE